MKIAKVREVITPRRGTEGSAGIDFFIPDDFPGHLLAPGESVNIPSGITAEVPKGFMLCAFNKSGVATRKQLIVGACIVDADYQGEIHLHVMNVGLGGQMLMAGEKIMQFVLLPVAMWEVEEVPKTRIHLEKTGRGEGGFGSTDKEEVR